MIRIAAESDVPEILSVYAPYILTTTVTFEYEVPSEAEFLARFRSVTARFPWLVWEEEGRILGYAYASPPYICARMPGAGESAAGSMPHWKKSCVSRVFS